MTVSSFLPLFPPPIIPLFFPPGGPGSDLPLYSEAASDHGADGVLSGGHQGERPQWFPAGKMPLLFFILETTSPTFSCNEAKFSYNPSESRITE